MSEPPSSPSPSPASAPSRAARSPVVVLVGLQLLFAVAVMAAVWGSSQHLRRLALEHLLGHAQVQTHMSSENFSSSPSKASFPPVRKLQVPVCKGPRHLSAIRACQTLLWHPKL